jgi:hypothetical protein
MVQPVAGTPETTVGGGQPDILVAQGGEPPQPQPRPEPATSPGTSGFNDPSQAQPKATFDKVFASVDKLLQDYHGKLPAGAKPPLAIPKEDFAQAHFARVKNIHALLTSLPAKEATELRTQLVNLGKEIGVNFGLRTGGQDSPAVNSGVQLGKPLAQFLKLLVEKVSPLFANNGGSGVGNPQVTATPGTPGAPQAPGTPEVQPSAKPADYDQVQKLITALPKAPDPKLDDEQFKSAALARLGKLLEAADRIGADGKPGKDNKLSKDEFADFLKNFGALLPKKEVELLGLLATNTFKQDNTAMDIQETVSMLNGMPAAFLKSAYSSN